jgi:hypothetical protein
LEDLSVDWHSHPEQLVTYCQLNVLKEDLLPVLLKMLENDDCEEARIKALYAISCNEHSFFFSISI